MLENEPTHLILCSKVRDGSILPTHCDWRKDAVFLEQITWDEVFARYAQRKSTKLRALRVLRG